jgi:lipopolysaccharide export system permease protein
VSALLIPALVTVVLPVSLLISVIYTFTSMNTDSELVVINASGAPLSALLKPVLAIGIITMLLVGALSLYFAPLSLRTWQVLVTSVRSDILNAVLRPGGFVTLTPKLTFHIRDRNPDGSFRGIFVSDDREANTTLTYIAERGAVLDNPLGVFLIMSNGTIQQRNTIDSSISMIEFSSYAFDLSSFTSSGAIPDLRPAERDTGYLINPDPEDRVFRQFPQKFRAELHDRLSSPLYALLFAVLPLAFLGQAESARQSRTASIATCVVATIAARTAGVFLSGLAETSTLAVFLMYAVPTALTVASVMVVLRGIQLRPPDRVVAISEAAFARASGLLRTGTEATAGGSG